MDRIIHDLPAAVVLGLIVPALLLVLTVSLRQEEAAPVEPDSEPVYTEASRVERQEVYISVLTEDGRTRQMELSAYLTGVLLAEMPVSFEDEALKAQAVVARTYAIRAQSGRSKHENAAVCMQSSCCQGCLPSQAYLDAGGRAEQVERIGKLVAQTANLVLKYGGELIEATYFSCSGGSTEDAVAVWGTDVPYLQATPSPGEEAAAYFENSVAVTSEEFAAKLSVTLAGDPSGWIGQVSYTDGGGVDVMEICGKSFKGTELRSLLGLRSTAFTISPTREIVTITTRGYGHRVGMSQYGADAMAASGSDFVQILAHYYQGTQLCDWSD